MSKGSIRRDKRRAERRLDNEAESALIAAGQIPFGIGRGTKMIENARKWLKFAKTPPTAFGDQDIYGASIPRSYGTFRHLCSILWTTKLVPLVEEVGEPFAENYKASFAAKICDGEQGALLRVWFNGILVLDRTSTSGDGYSSAPDFSNKIIFYSGGASQTASPVIEAEEGAGFVPAYRGTCYLVAKDIPMGRFSNQLPEIEAEVVGSSVPDYTTYDVTGFTAPATANITNLAISRRGSLVYQYNAGILSVIGKRVTSVIEEIDVQAALDAIAAGCSVVGRICLDDESAGPQEALWFGCEDSGGAAFLLRYDGGWASNYSSRVSGASFDSLFVYGGLVYVADGAAGKVYCYQKRGLSLRWSRTTPMAGSSAGNFTADNAGFVWVTWYDSGDLDTFNVTRFTPGGSVVHFALNDEGFSSSRGIAYDFDNNCLVSGGADGQILAKWTLTAGGVPEYATHINTRTCDNALPLFVSQYRFSRTFYTTQGTSLYKFRVGSWTAVETIALSNFADTGTGNEAYAYDYLTRSLWICRDAAPGMSKLPLNRETSEGTTLSAVLSALSLAAGLAAGDIDVTEATGETIAGYAIQDQTSAEGPLSQLMTAYQYGVREHYESGYAQIKLEWIDRETEAAASNPDLYEEEMGVGDGAPTSPVLDEELEDEESLPRRVIVRYADTRRAYSAHAQTDQIDAEVTSATEEIAIELPNLVLTDDQAKQLAQKLLASAWTEGERKSFTLPLEYLQIEPEDVFVLSTATANHSIRIEEIELGANYVLSFSAVRISAEQFTSSATGDPGEANTDTVEAETPSGLLLVDCPAVRDIDGAADDAGLYLFVSPKATDTEWPGARVYRSLDDALYTTVATVTSGATWGVCVDTLADGDHFTFDADSSLIVRLIHGSLSTQTADALAEDALLNFCAVGSEEDGWELLQFATVTDNLDGTYTLTGMRRGRFGTELMTATHTLGERFVLFDFSSAVRLRLGLQERGQERFYKAVTIGTPQAAVRGRAFTCQAKSLMPYAPVEVSGVESGGTWTLNWSRRTRIGGGLSDYTDIALNEETEEYEVDLRESPTGPVLRTLVVGPGLPALSGVNLSADAAAQKFVRASGDWTLAFFVGQRVETAGFSNAGNNGRWTIAALTATDMTVTSGETTLVTEASASGRTLTAVTPAVQYTAAQQTADGGSKSSFYAEVYQISDTLREQDGQGRGFTVQVLIS